ncbi:hypothetical protein [Parabacteroides sp. Marseille-P3160]|uniref:hypothetical protein n=1 Tax=Parabacteroides sp. Marseille-P3160 TaxID=1917887 RepID=UPI0009B939BD|nr:hypothetical protein [Parabacteroides sp. Marseille-P3160]
MKRLRRNFFLQLLAIIGGGGIIGGVILYDLLPSEYFIWYPWIPLFYITMGIMLIAILKYCEKQSNQMMLNIYLLTRVLKLFLTIILMILYVFYVEDHRESFLLTIGIFYIVYLILETKFFFTFEKSLKKMKQTDDKFNKQD